MASEIDICNVALALIGDSARVTAINPPDQSVQASHCSRFYPIARDALLEMHAWGFATTRVALAELASNPSSTWQHVYAAPSNAINFLEILDPRAPDDFTFGVTPISPTPNVIMQGPGVIVAQPFVVENIDSAQVIYTNQADAVLRYVQLITDPAEFSPLFATGLSLLLSSYLAGPIIKGSEGRATAREQMAAFTQWIGMAKESDANQRRVDLKHGPSWIQGR